MLIKIEKNFIEKSLLRYIIPLYLAGLLIPYLYILLLKNFYKILLIFQKKRDVILSLLLIFLSIQIVSTYLSIFLPLSANYEHRYIAIFHNYTCFTFLILGYYFVLYNNDFYYTIKKYLPMIFWFMLISSIALFSLFFILKSPISYNGVLYYILNETETKYSVVKLVDMGFTLNRIIPRVEILGLYPNTTAILMYVIYTLYISHIPKNRILRLSFLSIISILSIMTTGSRIVLVVFIIFLVFNFFNERKKFFFSLSILIILIFIFHFFVYDLLLFLKSLRASSNSMRMLIYKISLIYLQKYNVILGLGIKPKVDILGKYPIASHSTFVGYFVKNGIIGGFLFLFIFFLFLRKFFESLFKRRYNIKDRLIFSIIGLFVIYVFEDLDAYELTSFFSGVLLGFWRVYDRSYNKQNFQF